MVIRFCIGAKRASNVVLAHGWPVFGVLDVLIEYVELC